tara:strand:- start:8148 stop:9446 length:1299 start_codon:yes stop_codon:yes gene_type:complete
MGLYLFIYFIGYYFFRERKLKLQGNIMKTFKFLPIAVAVATSIASFSALAADDVAALTERIQALEAQSDPDLALKFTGYARYGARYAGGDSELVGIGSTGVAVGRLGNEANGGEFQLTKGFKTESGMHWDLAVMLDHWSSSDWGSEGGANVKKLYASGTNLFESQPGLRVWGGRDFHQRPQQGLNDYMWLAHDGQGAGFDNLDLGGAKFNLAFVGQVSDNGGALGNDNGKYAITSKLHGIDAGIGNLDIYANYGFASDQAGVALEDENSWLIGATLGLGASNKLIAKYADGADNSAFDLAGDKQVMYISLEGGVNPSENVFIDYLVSYKNISGTDATEQSEYSAIIRPMYNWNSVHSTWLEAGYAMVDQDAGGDQQGWKVTASQNISMGGLPWSRPMVRLYATFGDVETTDASSVSTNVDTASVGAMFEAWW